MNPLDLIAYAPFVWLPWALYRLISHRIRNHRTTSEGES